MSISVVANPRKATTITAATTAAKAVLVGKKDDDDLGLFPIMLTIGRRLITSLKLYTQPFVKLLKFKRHVIQGRETGAKCKAISQTEKKNQDGENTYCVVVNGLSNGAPFRNRCRDCFFKFHFHHCFLTFS